MRSHINSDPAHPHFWHKCLPNEEQIENPKNSSIFRKNVYEQRSPPTQITQCSKKCYIRFMRSVIIKEASQDEQQNQTTITTNINYIQNFMSMLKKLTNKLKIASDIIEYKQITCVPLEKIWNHSIKRFGSN